MLWSSAETAGFLRSPETRRTPSYNWAPCTYVTLNWGLGWQSILYYTEFHKGHLLSDVDVVLGSVNMVFKDEDNILDQIYKKNVKHLSNIRKGTFKKINSTLKQSTLNIGFEFNYISIIFIIKIRTYLIFRYMV